MPDGTGSSPRSPEEVATHVSSTLHDLILMSDRNGGLDDLADILTTALLETENVRRRISDEDAPPLLNH